MHFSATFVVVEHHQVIAVALYSLIRNADGVTFHVHTDVAGLVAHEEASLCKLAARVGVTTYGKSLD